MNAVFETKNRSTRPANGGDRGFVTPPANISADENEYLLEVEMPGVSQDGLEVTVEGNELTIIGRRKSDLPTGELCYCESAMADHRRVFELGPDVDTSRIKGQMEQGVLKLHLPKSERAKPKKIEIQAS
ncbi:MAG TPA: Hsp20/alpha crystallin family protein [Verrucomicrobiae bacterium]|jgi:HSP20 family molecular chaperone IbpA|nr:Hsp20/alpha crystallin family protein [Verrucomicrobiae bacterium]